MKEAIKTKLLMGKTEIKRASVPSTIQLTFCKSNPYIEALNKAHRLSVRRNYPYGLSFRGRERV